MEHQLSTHEFFSENYDNLLGLARSVTRQGSNAADLLHDVFISMSETEQRKGGLQHIHKNGLFGYVKKCLVSMHMQNKHKENLT